MADPHLTETFTDFPFTPSANLTMINPSVRGVPREGLDTAPHGEGVQ